MANLVKSYFLPPEWVYKPGGPIFLGSLVVDPHQPQESLNPKGFKAGSALPLSVDDEKLKYEAVIDTGKDFSVGVDASFLSMFGLGGSVGVSRGKNLVYTLNAEKLRTQEISPDIDYINTQLLESHAIEFMTKKLFKTDVYCVTGLMIGSNVTIKSHEKTSKGLSGSVGVGGAAVGAPVEVGPNFSTSRTKKTTASGQQAKELILGYRLKHVTWMKKEKRARTKRYDKGAVLSHGRDEVDGDTEDDQSVYFAQALRLDDEEICADEFDFRSVMVDDGSSASTTIELVMPIKI